MSFCKGFFIHLKICFLKLKFFIFPSFCKGILENETDLMSSKSTYTISFVNGLFFNDNLPLD